MITVRIAGNSAIPYHKNFVMRAKNYQLVEVVKPSTMTSQGNRLYFGDQPQLRTLANRAIRIHSVSCYPGSVIGNSPSGKAVADGTDFTDAYLVLNVASIEKFLFIPLTELNPVVSQGTATEREVREYFETDSTWYIDWTKSYIQFGTAPSATEVAYIFGVRYSIYPDDYQPILLPGNVTLPQVVE